MGWMKGLLLNTGFSEFMGTEENLIEIIMDKFKLPFHPHTHDMQYNYYRWTLF